MGEEDGEIGNDFSMSVAQAWEGAFFSIHTSRTRKVALRISLVLGNDGGVIPVLSKLTKVGLGGYHGNGRQKFAWIHIVDVIRIIEYIQENSNIEGVINCTAPSEIDNRKFMKSLREALHFPFGLPTPKLLLEIGAFVMGTESELMLKSRFVKPQRLLEAGYKFKYSDVDKALKDLTKDDRK